jgi:hypothetical protein
MELTGFGKSDKPIYAERKHALGDPENPFDTARMSEKDRATIAAVGKILLAHSELSVNGPFPGGKFNYIDFIDDEKKAKAVHDHRGEWGIHGREDQVGAVVRFGDGNEKHYVLHLRGPDGYFQVFGQPPYDVPLFGAPSLDAHPMAPVMVHEGPKAWAAACGIAEAVTASLGRDPIAAAAGRALLKEQNVPRLFGEWIALHVHVGWHGSEAGIEWTDWSALRGRKVVLWSDCDETGLINSRLIADRLSCLGNVVDYVSWSQQQIEDQPGWDLADKFRTPLTRSEVRAMMLSVESPFDNQGRVLREWAKRSFVDADEGLIYARSRNYRPLKEKSIRDRFGKFAWGKIIQSPVNPYVGSVFLPGEPLGRSGGGLVNTCPPSAREPIHPRLLPMREWRELHGWLRRLVPDRDQRKYLLRRAALALIHPDKVPQSMVLMRGNSGTGKSLFLTSLIAVAGADRAGIVGPKALFKDFNASIENKSIACVHEIHGNDLNRKEMTNSLKELIGNTSVSIHRKYENEKQIKATIHWFAATNEKTPLVLEAGNNRFFFVDCGALDTPPEQEWILKFTAKWYKKLTTDEAFLDLLYAAAKKVMKSREKKLGFESLVQRPKPQATWGAITIDSMVLWQQEVYEWTRQFTNSDHEVFFAADILRLVKRYHPRVPSRQVADFLNKQGFRSLTAKTPKLINKRVRNEGVQETLWARKADFARLIATPNDYPWSIGRFSVSDLTE